MTPPPDSANHASIQRFDHPLLLEALPLITGSAVTEVRISPLKGDASDRVYFRVTYRKDSQDNNSSSMIIMQLQAPVLHEETDFIRILKFLEAQELPVPELFHYDAERGLLFLEDCGHATMEDRVRDHPKDREVCYRQAVELLAELHHRATQNIDSSCPAFYRRFDVEKLMWEMDFMLEHYVKGLKQSSLNEKELAEVRSHLHSLSKTLAQEEPTFTHRDYHCRNLMAQGGKLILLDFQDARMGPCQYDLASLLKDSYVSLGEGFRSEMIEHYIKQKEKREGRAVDRPEFNRIFDWMSLQRNLKAVGTFAYQSVVKKNHGYLEYIPGTLAYVRQTLDTRPDLDKLKQCLTRCIPGLDS